MASKLVRKLEHCVRLCVSNRGSCFKKDSWALNARGAIELFRGEAERDRGQAGLPLESRTPPTAGFRWSSRMGCLFA